MALTVSRIVSDNFKVGMELWLKEGSISVLFLLGFLSYQLNEDMRLKDGDRQGVFGYLVGLWLERRFPLF